MIAAVERVLEDDALDEYERFSDFVDKSDLFDDLGSMLFKKMCSNLSFKIEDEVIYVVHGILTSRSDYFRAMLEGSFREAQAPMTVESEIPIGGIKVRVFKMIIEWIFSLDIIQLNGLSVSILEDLEDVYVAADMYLLPDLCKSIERYLIHLIDRENFGEINLIAKRIGSETVEAAVYLEWVAKPGDYNKTDKQLERFRLRCDYCTPTQDGELCCNEKDEDASLFNLARKIIQTSNWEGDKESKLGVIKCLTALLNLDAEETEKRKIAAATLPVNMFGSIMPVPTYVAPVYTTPISTYCFKPTISRKERNKRAEQSRLAKLENIKNRRRNNNRR